MSRPLSVTDGQLHSFNQAIPSILRDALDLGKTVYLACNAYENTAHATTKTFRVYNPSNGAQHARVRTLRGYDIDVVRFQPSLRMAVFIGLSFDWVTKGKSHRFASAQFIVFTSPAIEGRNYSQTLTDARQVLRLEWVGLQEDGTFERGGHAHPHWQVDEPPPQEPPLLPNSAVVDLDQVVVDSPVQEKHWLSKIHLASAADDWSRGTGWPGDPDACSAHAKGPETIDALKLWVGSASRYLRLQIVSALSR